MGQLALDHGFDSILAGVGGKRLARKANTCRNRFTLLANVPPRGLESDRP